MIPHESEQVRLDAEDAGGVTQLCSLAGLRVERERLWKEYVRRIAGEDHFALTALFDESSPLVFATALRVLNFPADAEEVTTDVYIRIWRTAKSYDALRGNVDAWLVSIARSRAIDRLRSRATRDRYEAGTSIECSGGVDPESSAAASQTNRHLQLALHTLPFEQRRAIELAYFSELTMAEIAEQLGHPIGSVKTRIRMGLMKLRRKLAAVA